MSEEIVTTMIEILGKPYPVKCPVSKQKSLQQAAEFLNKKMSEVKESGKAINFERIAIITALNITYLFLEQDQQKSSLMNKINHRISQLQDRLETAINKSLQAELIYSAE